METIGAARVRNEKEPQRREREEQLRKLREEALALNANGLWDAARNVVFGEGPADSRLMLVGEAPGDNEDRLGRPFVGRAGKLLDDALIAAGIDRSAAYVTNAVKIRPTLQGARGLKNRPPTREEVALWRPWLDSELDIVRPEVIVCLGATAANAIIRPKFKITRERGVFEAGPKGALTMATYHPSYVMRFQGEAFTRVFETVVSDLRLARERLG